MHIPLTSGNQGSHWLRKISRMPVARSNSFGSARKPPERAYLWVPRNGCTQGEDPAGSGLSGRGQRSEKDTHREGSNPSAESYNRKCHHVEQTDRNNEQGGQEGERYCSNHGGAKTDKDNLISPSGRKGVGSSENGCDHGSMRRPVTAAVKTTRAASSAARDSSTSPSRGASGHSEVAVDYRVPAAVSSSTGQSVIYDTPTDRTREQESLQQQQQQQKLRLQQQQGGLSSRSSNNHALIDCIGSSYPLQAHSLIGSHTGRDDSGRGKEIGRSFLDKRYSERNDKEVARIYEAPSRCYSSLGFNSSRTLTSKPRHKGRDSVQFYSTRYNRSSQLFSAKSRYSVSHDKALNSQGSTGFANPSFHSESNHRPQTARVESPRKPGAYVISRYRGSLDSRRPVTARQSSSTDITFKNHLQQQERHRHHHPSSARLVNNPYHRSSSPQSSASSDGKPPSAPTPNLYRQLALVTPGPAISKIVQLNTGQQRPASETVRRDSGTQDSAVERREALSVQRSQSSLSILGGGARAGTPSNFSRYDSGFISARPSNKISSISENTFSNKRRVTGSKEVDSAGKDFGPKSRSTSVRITTRAPSSANISVDSRRHNETSKILELVGRQPGFLSTLALIPSVPPLDETRNTALEPFQAVDANESNEDTSKDTIHLRNSDVVIASSRIVDNLHSSAPETNLTFTRSKDTQWHEIEDDIYRNHLPNSQSDFILGKVNTPLSDFQETTDETKESNLKVTKPITPNRLQEQTKAGRDESQPSIFSGDRQRRNTSGVVTFDLPDDGDKTSSIEDSQGEQDDESEQGQTTGSDDEHCKMSAPELPPIALAGINTGKAGNSPVGKTPREHKRKTSNNSNHSSGSRASIHQMSNAVNSKTYYNRKTNHNSNSNHAGGGGGGTGSISTNTSTSSKRVKKKRLPIPRNHSDSSLKGLLAQQQQQQQTSSFTGSSCSSNILPNNNVDGMMGLGDGGASNSRQIKYMANGSRALSWCATENSGSQLKLETLFEGQNNHQGQDSDPPAENSTLSSAKGMSGIMNSSIYSGRILASPLSNHMHRTESNTSINNMLGNTNGRTSTPPIMMNNSNNINSIHNFRSMNNHSSLSGQFGVGGEPIGRKTASVKGGGGATDMPPILPPRSVSVNGIRSREDIARLVALNRFGDTPVDEGAQVVVDTVEDILARGHLRRSQSENRLHGRLASGGMLHQAAGENLVGEGSPGKLQGGNQRQPNQGRSLSRNLSVDRLDRLTARPGHKRPSRVGSYTNVNNSSNNNNSNNNNNTYNKQHGGKTSNNTSGGGGRLRKVSSMSAMPVDRVNSYTSNSYNNSNNNNNNNNSNTKNNNKTEYTRSKTGQNNNSSPTRYNQRATSKRYTSHRDSVMDDYDNQEDDTPPEDEEGIEASARLVEWLNVVNNIDEYDTDPQHTVVEYADEPPQTDTAVHVVYEGH